MKTEYISKEVVNEIEKLLNACKKKLNEKNIYVKLYDTEQYLGTFNDMNSVIEEMDGGDEYFEIVVFNEDDLPKGTFYVSPYEEPSEIVYDYTDNFFCEDVMKIYDKGE